MSDMTDPSSPFERVTFWLRPDGQVAVHRVWLDENGIQYGETGEPAPPGTELDSEGVTRAVRAQTKALSDAHADHQAAAKKVIAAAVTARKAKLKELVDAGLPEVAAEVILGPAPAFKPTSFQPDPEAADGLRNYDLSNEQITRILHGWN